MANQKLFISNEAAFAIEPLRVGNSMSTRYTYDGDKLTLFWRGCKVAEKSRVKFGDAFVVHCNGDKPTLSTLKVPHRNDDLLMWLLSFDKECRAHDVSEYQSLLAKQRQENGQWGYRDWGIEGEGYAFKLCNRSDCGGVYHIAAYVNETNKAMVKEVLRKWERGLYWPQEFVTSLLKKRFGFTNREIEELRALQCI